MEDTAQQEEVGRQFEVGVVAVELRASGRGSVRGRVRGRGRRARGRRVHLVVVVLQQQARGGRGGRRTRVRRRHEPQRARRRRLVLRAAVTALQPDAQHVRERRLRLRIHQQRVARDAAVLYCVGRTYLSLFYPFSS